MESGSKFIVILEDNAERVDAMRVVLAKELPGISVKFFDESQKLISWLNGNIDRILIISLDHDLGPNRSVDGQVVDPGVGRDVTKYLADKVPICHVIIHTSNTLGGQSMELDLSHCGWEVDRVYPVNGNEWIRDSWISRVKAFVGKTC